MNYLMPNSIVGSPYQALTPGGGGQDITKGNAFLRLDIKPTNFFPNYTPVTSIPNYTVDWEPSVRDTFGVNRRRLKNLILTPRPNPNVENKFTIDGIEYNMLVINDTICLGAKEIWTINNKSGIAHPFHIHKVFFRVLDIDSLGTPVSLHKYGLNGPKDDVMILPNWKLRFLAVFDDFPTAISPHNCYMYHCHILTHEDSIGGGMMHQFVVTQDANCIPNQSTPPKEMGLFPNPFRSGELFLKGVSGETSTLQIYDLLGQLIRKQELDPFWGNTLIDADGIQPGLYIVKWNNSKGKFAGKLLITQ
jgi:bilirubin oxidase